MPAKIVKRGGSRPYKIVESSTGKVKGTSTSKGKPSRTTTFTFMTNIPLIWALARSRGLLEFVNQERKS